MSATGITNFAYPPAGKPGRLAGEFDAVVLPGPPRGLDAVPPDKVLVCLGGMGEYAAELESWAERDWIAVIGIRPGRERLDGPLLPFPGPAAG
jgi:hypothetical protein